MHVTGVPGWDVVLLRGCRRGLGGGLVCDTAREGSLRSMMGGQSHPRLMCGTSVAGSVVSSSAGGQPGTGPLGSATKAQRAG